MPVSPRALIEKLNPVCRRALEAAAGLCLSRTHFNVEIEHWLTLLLDAKSDLPGVLKQYDVSGDRVRRDLEAAMARFKTGNGRSPSLAPDLLDLVREAWVAGSLGYNAGRVRSAHVLVALANDRTLSGRMREVSPELARLPAERLAADLADLLPHLTTDETDAAPAAAGDAPAAQGGGTGALEQYTADLTDRARKGLIDPVIGRDGEIRQVIDILTRRRQNNPILTGEAGVGKTAVVEGLALRVAAGDVPPPLRPVVLRTLDLGLLQAGAGVKGEFENRLKSVIQEVKASPKPVILFIDEAHTLIGAGGQAGQGDAANLLKPALARGELRTIAATTFAEYKKYFEGDAALKRRFQQVRVEEPDEAKAVRMLRGLSPMLEKHHKVRILDEALTDAVRLSTRYMPDRQLPDKAVSLLDTVCASVALSQSATPPPLENARREIELVSAEIAFLEREDLSGEGHPERLAELRGRKAAAEGRAAALEKQLEAERKLVADIGQARAAAEEAKGANGHAEVDRLEAELRAVQGETPLVYPVVAGGAVAEVVAALTGVPLGKMVRDEVQTILHLKDKLAARVVGQDAALAALAESVRVGRADLADPRRPIGVFLLVGPSGVGKTETAAALADVLFGGDRGMVVVNMSEYKESSKISRLTGTAKGYVGYGEGGVLTNAVKNRPYSVVLLDEVEKADQSVQEIFYQVFDKGVLQNDDGEEVSFKNTIVLLTSNVGTDTIARLCADPDTCPDAAGLGEALRPDLLKAFKPALLGRMTVLPYFPLSEAALERIIRLKLNQIAERVRVNHKAAFAYDDAVVKAVAARCKEVESGARNADHILSGTLLPAVATELLSRMAEGTPVRSVQVGVDGAANFTYEVA